MSKITVTLPAEHIVAALITAPVADVRFYLVGALIEAHGTHAHLVTTDGHRMTIFREDAPTEGTGVFIVPRKLLEGIKPAKRSAAKAVITYDTDTKRVEVAYSDALYVGTAIDGKFPAWRMVVPASCTGKPQQFDSAYLADAAKQVKALGEKSNALRIHHSATGGAGNVGMRPAVLTIAGRPEYLGLLMSILTDGDALPDVAAFIAGAAA